jgi:hypothetical protein
MIDRPAWQLTALLFAFLAQTAAPAAAEPANPTTVLAFEEIVTLGPVINVGKTPRGTRIIIPITGGTFKGPRIAGTIIPGGWDWQLGRADGCTEVEADYMLRTHDGVVINIRNEGTLCPPEAGQPSTPARTQPRFEAPIGKYDWLNRGSFVGTLEVLNTPDQPSVKITIYETR